MLDPTPALFLLVDLSLLPSLSVFRVIIQLFRFSSVQYTFFSPVEVPAPSITHSTLLAGTECNLTCDYSLDFFPHEASASWTVNGNEVLIEGVTLSFSPLNTADNGKYSCELNITSLTPYVIAEGPPRRSDELSIAVESKS